jgi:hypothetical protein
MEHLLNYYVIIKLVNNLVIHAKTKQMKIKHHYLIKRSPLGDVIATYVPTSSPNKSEFTN